MWFRIDGVRVDYDTTRFWAKVRKTESCWLWTGANNRHKYGNINVNGVTRRPNRLSYAIHIGDPIGFDVLHECDNPPCVNPKHLFLGDDKDNATDKVNKDRQLKGITHPLTRISSEQLAIIISRIKRGDRHLDIARDFGLSRSYVTMIGLGKKRKDG